MNAHLFQIMLLQKRKEQEKKDNSKVRNNSFRTNLRRCILVNQRTLSPSPEEFPVVNCRVIHLLTLVNVALRFAGDRAKTTMQRKQTEGIGGQKKYGEHTSGIVDHILRPSTSASRFRMSHTDNHHSEHPSRQRTCQLFAASTLHAYSSLGL